MFQVKTGHYPGANIKVERKAVGTNTDFDGNFTIAADSGDVLVISFVDFQFYEFYLFQLIYLI